MDIFLLSLSVCMALVMYFDLTSYTIPNWLNAAVLVLYVPFAVMQPEGFNWWMPALGALMLFLLCLGVFALSGSKFLGAGDMKLLVATSVWVGFSLLLVEYLVIISILGGILALVLVVVRKMLFWLPARFSPAALPAVLQEGKPAPYGLAIAGAFVYFLWTRQLPGF